MAADAGLLLLRWDRVWRLFIVSLPSGMERFRYGGSLFVTPPMAILIAVAAQTGLTHMNAPADGIVAEIIKSIANMVKIRGLTAGAVSVDFENYFKFQTMTYTQRL